VPAGVIPTASREPGGALVELLVHALTTHEVDDPIAGARAGGDGQAGLGVGVEGVGLVRHGRLSVGWVETVGLTALPWWRGRPRGLGGWVGQEWPAMPWGLGR
jgi:hypothetical protein